MSLCPAPISAASRFLSSFRRSSSIRFALSVWSAPRIRPLNSALSSRATSCELDTTFRRTAITFSMNSFPTLCMLRASSLPTGRFSCSGGFCSIDASCAGARASLLPQPRHCASGTTHRPHLVARHSGQTASCAPWHSSHLVCSFLITDHMLSLHSCSAVAAGSSCHILSCSPDPASPFVHCSSSWIFEMPVRHACARRGCNAWHIPDQLSRSICLPSCVCLTTSVRRAPICHSHLPTPIRISTGNMSICAAACAHPPGSGALAPDVCPLWPSCAAACTWSCRALATCSTFGACRFSGDPCPASLASHWRPSLPVVSHPWLRQS